MLLELPKPRMDEDYLGGQMRYEERTARRVKAGRMLRANRAFTALDDGEKIAITTDSYVVAEHAIARRYPDCFDLVLTARERAELLEAELEHAKQQQAERRLARAERRRAKAKRQQAEKVRRIRAQIERLQLEAARAVRHALSVTTTQTRVTPGVWEIRSSPGLSTQVTVKPPQKPQYRVTLRDTRSSTSIVISEFAYEVIERECMRFAHLGDIETGGFLAGTVARSWDTSIRVTDARGPGPKTEHKSNAMRIDFTGAYQLERDFAWAEANIGETGFWHTHPRGGTRPSPDDLQTWADSLRYTGDKRGAGLYVGVIATPNRQRGNWAFPNLTAYIVRRGVRDGYVCEPAGVTIRSSARSSW